MKISFFVRGQPKAQPRGRAFAVGGKARIYNPATAEGWKGAIACAALQHLPTEPLTGPLRVDIDFFLPRPKRLMRRKDADGHSLSLGRGLPETQRDCRH